MEDIIFTRALRSINEVLYKHISQRMDTNSYWNKEFTVFQAIQLFLVLKNSKMRVDKVEMWHFKNDNEFQFVPSIYTNFVRYFACAVKTETIAKCGHILREKELNPWSIYIYIHPREWILVNVNTGMEEFRVLQVLQLYLVKVKMCV